MKELMNPFVTSGYVSSTYFCDREEETSQLLKEIQKRWTNFKCMISFLEFG